MMLPVVMKLFASFAVENLCRFYSYIGRFACNIISPECQTIFSPLSSYLGKAMESLHTE